MFAFTRFSRCFQRHASRYSSSFGKGSLIALDARKDLVSQDVISVHEKIFIELKTRGKGYISLTFFDPEAETAESSRECSIQEWKDLCVEIPQKSSFGMLESSGSFGDCLSADVFVKLEFGIRIHVVSQGSKHGFLLGISSLSPKQKVTHFI